MKRTADAVVIGGGVMGCSILYNLALKGISNTLLLEMNALGSGSTSRSQAILRMHYSNEVTTRMAWESLRVYQSFEEVIGGPSGYTKTGYALIVDGSDRHALQDNVAMQQAVGVDTAEMSPEELMEAAPTLRISGDEACAFEPESGYADTHSVTQSYAEAARRLGASIATQAPTLSVEVLGGRAVGVRTPHGSVSTPLVVVAAGPWSRQVLSKVGIEAPLETVRHQVFVLRRPESLEQMHPIIGDVVNDLSARPDIGGLTLVGVGEDERGDPDGYDQGVDMQMFRGVAERLEQRMPGMSQASFLRGWSGLFTITPDWHPILDKAGQIDGLYVAVGFSGHGFKLAPMIGVTMAELIAERPGPTTIDISQLGMDRFAGGRLLRSRYGMSVLA